MFNNLILRLKGPTKIITFTKKVNLIHHVPERSKSYVAVRSYLDVPMKRHPPDWNRDPVEIVESAGGSYLSFLTEDGLSMIVPLSDCFNVEMGSIEKTITVKEN